MRTTFFVPRGEECPVKPGHTIAGRLVIDQFVGNVTTPGYIGYTFTVRSLTLRERLSQWQDGTAEEYAAADKVPLRVSQPRFPSQWAKVRQAG